MILPMPSVQGPPVNSMMRAAQLPGGTLAAMRASATCRAVPVQRVGRSLLSTGYASRCRSAEAGRASVAATIAQGCELGAATAVC